MFLSGGDVQFATLPVIAVAAVGVLAILLFVVVFGAYLILGGDRDEAEENSDPPEPRGLR